MADDIIDIRFPADIIISDLGGSNACCNTEIQGLKKIALYVNKDVRFNRPDISKENEIDLIAHSIGSVVIDCQNEYAKWQREINYSGNYKQNYMDTFVFNLHGILNNTPELLKTLRETRTGWICEIITKSNDSFVFPTPIFVSKAYLKDFNSHSWEIEMKYRVPTFDNYLIKLNSLLMTQSYILVDDNKILGDGEKPIVPQ